jgi:hypothetical protein
MYSLCQSLHSRSPMRQIFLPVIRFFRVVVGQQLHDALSPPTNPTLMRPLLTIKLGGLISYEAGGYCSCQ